MLHGSETWAPNASDLQRLRRNDRAMIRWICGAKLEDEVSSAVLLDPRHHQANLVVCVVCSCCTTSPYKEVCRAKGGIGSGEIVCHDIYPARLTTTVSLAANVCCMTDCHSLCAPRTVDPRVQFSGTCEQSH